jgi:L-alanine-DL-glutamate epimerase-like enolase superfamily enzyme
VRITRIEPIVISVPFEHGGPKPMRSSGPWTSMDALLVRIDTDGGISGWGEAFGFAASPVTQAALQHVFAPLCIGKDPEPMGELMATLRRSTVNMGTSGPVRYALSGIELALWDIAGKIKQQPLHALLGGAKRSQIPTYASFLPYHDVALVERNVDECRNRGYKHIKLHERTVDTVAAARRVGGDDLKLMLDTNCAWSLADAVDMAQKLEPFDLMWLEEPIYPPDDFAALATLEEPWCERFYCELEAYVAGDAVAVADRMMAVPQGPGLGITIDEALVARYRIG